MSGFMTGIHRRYELMMRYTPQHSDEAERKIREHYDKQFRRFMKENNLKILNTRVKKALGDMFFDEFMFLNAQHRNTFYCCYNSYRKAKNRPSDCDIAVIYLLSSSDCFYELIRKFINQRYVNMPKKSEAYKDMLSYNVFHAAKLILGKDSKLEYADLFEDGIIDNNILCLILNALFIKKYGYECCIEGRKVRHNDGYIRNSKKGINRLYFYKNQAVKVQ